MIGIIGFGRFGKLTARYLAEDFGVFVFNAEFFNFILRSRMQTANHGHLIMFLQLIHSFQ